MNTSLYALCRTSLSGTALKSPPGHTSAPINVPFMNNPGQEVLAGEAQYFVTLRPAAEPVAGAGVEWLVDGGSWQGRVGAAGAVRSRRY
ncbi:MAG: hypothetical protein U5K38_14015 [Woeseiaceae bacterium]|nr:hypothetical protein [Woeseiaceae bacterium]